MLVVSCGKSTDELTRMLSDENVETRISAAVELQKLADPDTISALIVALGDPENRVWYCAYWALVEIGEPAVPALIEQSRDVSSAVCESTMAILGEI